MILKTISKLFNVPLMEEVKEGSKRYDFYFPTKPPICIEVNGAQHFLNKCDGFFFKDTQSLLNYKRNDLERKIFNKTGAIVLIEFTDEEFPTLIEMIEKLEDAGAEKILKQGVDENNAFYKILRKNKDREEERKRKNREFRKQIQKQKNNSRDRLVES